MSTTRNHNDKDELLRRLLESEATDADQRTLRENPELAAEYEDLLRTRAHLKGALDREPIPESLLGEVMASVEGGAATPSNVYQMSPRRKKQFWIFSAVGSLAMTFVIWTLMGVFSDEESDPVLAGGTDTAEQVVADASLPVDTILQVGMTDHMRCAVAMYRKKIPAESTEKMKLKVGEEFADLVPIIGEEIDLARLVVAHRCTFNGREYVHLVLQGEDDLLVSVAITERHNNEVLQGRPDPASRIEGHDIHHRAVEGFEIAGFQTEKYLVFVASNLSVEQNLRAIEGIVGKVSEVVGS